MKNKNYLRINGYRLLTLLVGTTLLATSWLAPYSAMAETDAMRALYRKNINYYVIDPCGGLDDQTAEPEGEDPAVETTSGLELREQIAQLLFVGMSDKEEAKAIVKKYKIGGMMLVNGGTSLFSKEAIQEVQAESEIPLLVASDEEGGLVQRLKAQTGKYPTAKAMGAKTAKDVEGIGKEYGKKLADLGVNINYAPVVDIDDGHNSIISDTNRAFSSDPDIIAEKAGAFAKGMRKSNVTPVFKHFPGHGRADGDSHEQAVTTPHISSLKDKDLKPYEKMVSNGEGGVMMGHLIVPGLTGGKQATISPEAVNLLRGGEYNFNGVIFSDEIANMKAIADKYSPAEAVSLAIKAGIDMPLFNASSRYSSLDEQVKKTIDKVEADVTSGDIDKTQIEASLRRIGDLKSNSPAKDSAEITDPCACQNGGSTTLSGNNNIARVYNYLTDHELTPVQAAAVTGNLMWESGGGGKDIPTNRTNPKSGAYGIVQWLGGRLTGLKASVKPPKKVSDLDVQLDYLWYELSDPDSAEKKAYNVLEEIKAMDNLEQIVIHWEEEFERSEDVVGSNGMNERIRYAKQVQKNSGGGGGGTATDPSTPPANCSDGSGEDGSGISKGNFIWPIGGAIASCWKNPRGGHLHAGLDIAAGVGTSIKASDGGTVEQAGNIDPEGYGNAVIIKHSDGKWTLYAHMSKISVRKGQPVDQGQIIGKSGGQPGAPGSGSSRGAHLHFNLQKVGGMPSIDGTLNPLDYLPKDGRDLGGCKAGQAGP